MGYFLAMTSAFFFGASNIFFRQGISGKETSVDRDVGLFISILVNNITNLIVIGGYYLVRPWPSLNWTGVAFFLAGGLFTSFLGRFLLFSGIEKIGVARAGTLKITAPLFTVLIGVALLKEFISTADYLGIAAVLAGVALISRETQAVLSPGQYECAADENLPKGLVVKGVLLAVLSGLAYGVGNVFRKLGVTNLPAPLLGVALGSLMGLAVVLAVLGFQGKWPLIKTSFGEGLRGSYIMGGICTSLALYALFYSLNTTPVSIANSVGATEPLFMFLISYTFLKKVENVTRGTIWGSLTVVAGVILIVLL